MAKVFSRLQEVLKKFGLASHHSEITAALRALGDTALASGVTAGIEDVAEAGGVATGGTAEVTAALLIQAGIDAVATAGDVATGEDGDTTAQLIKDGQWQRLEYDPYSLIGKAMGVHVLFTVTGAVEVQLFASTVQDAQVNDGAATLALGREGSAGLFFPAEDLTILPAYAHYYPIAFAAGDPAPITDNDILLTLANAGGEPVITHGALDIVLFWRPVVAGSGASVVIP